MLKRAGAIGSPIKLSQSRDGEKSLHVCYFVHQRLAGKCYMLVVYDGEGVRGKYGLRFLKSYQQLVLLQTAGAMANSL